MEIFFNEVTVTTVSSSRFTFLSPVSPMWPDMYVRIIGTLSSSHAGVQESSNVWGAQRLSRINLHGKNLGGPWSPWPLLLKPMFTHVNLPCTFSLFVSPSSISKFKLQRPALATHSQIKNLKVRQKLIEGYFYIANQVQQLVQVCSCFDLTTVTVIILCMCIH